MPDVAKLLDSKKFCLIMDDLVKTWKKRDSTDDDKEYRLVQLFLVLEELGVLDDEAPKKPVELTPSLGASSSEPEETEEDLAPYAKLADEAAASNVPPAQIVDEVIRKYILPKYRNGSRHFAVPLRFKGRAVSVNHDRWALCLKNAGVSFNELAWVIDQRSWQGPMPSADQIPLTLS